MSISATDIQQLAITLCSGKSEVEWRSAGSRAYYAAYHLATDMAASLPDNSHFHLNGGTHARLIDRFETYRTFASGEGKKARSIAYMLKDMKQRREDCDYELHINITCDEALTAIEQCAVLDQKLAELQQLVLNPNSK